MRQTDSRRSLRNRVTTGLVAIAAAASAVTVGAGMAHAAPTATALPAHVFAPYFEAYDGDSLSGLSSQSGANYLTMAFIQAATPGSCTADWNGDSSTPLTSANFGSDIAAIQAKGGNVIPSFGGYTADDTGTEIADSCTNVNSIAAAYESVVTTYGVTRIDLDTEDNSLTNTAGIDRRNKAIAQVEAWAASTGRTVQFSYTLPTTTSGLAPSGLAVLQNAVANNARVDVANIMTFDYYDGATHEMANDAEGAATGLHSQLATLYPSKTSAQLWSMIGITLMPGVDDFGPGETTTVADAQTVESWAAGQGINTLAFWSLQRDSGNAAGITSSAWAFSKALEPFTGGGTTVPSNDFSVSVAPGSASIAPGASATATVSTGVTSGSAQSVSLSTSGAPAGVTTRLSSASVTAGGSATLTVTAASTAAAGTYPITVTGSAASGSHSATYSVTVTGTTGGGGTGGGGTTSGSLVNGTFETGALAPWTCQPGGAVVSSPVHAGTHALQVAPTASQTGECDQTLTLSPNHSYTLSGWVQGSNAYLGVSGGASASTWASGTAWTKLTIPFTTGASGTVTVYVHGWYGTGNVYADDLAVN